MLIEDKEKLEMLMNTYTKINITIFQKETYIKYMFMPLNTAFRIKLIN